MAYPDTARHVLTSLPRQRPYCITISETFRSMWGNAFDGLSLFQSFHVVTRPLDRSTDCLHIGHLPVEGDPDTMVADIGAELFDTR